MAANTKRLIKLTKIDSTVCLASSGINTEYWQPEADLEPMAGGATRIDFVFRAPGMNKGDANDLEVTIQTAANPTDEEFNAKWIGTPATISSENPSIRNGSPGRQGGRFA